MRSFAPFRAAGAIPEATYWIPPVIPMSTANAAPSAMISLNIPERYVEMVYVLSMVPPSPRGSGASAVYGISIVLAATATSVPLKKMIDASASAAEKYLEKNIWVYYIKKTEHPETRTL